MKNIASLVSAKLPH